MLYQEWDILLSSPIIRITPFDAADDEAFGRIICGEMYERFLELARKNHFSLTGIEAILNHTESDEHHALRLPDNDAFIGWIGLLRDEEGRPDIEISIAPAFQNRGIGPEAVKLFANHLHEMYGLERIYAHIPVLNQQCQRAFAKVGAVLDKTVPDFLFKALADKLPAGDPEKANIPDVYCYHIDLPIGC